MKKIVLIIFKSRTPIPELEKHWLPDAPKFGPNGEVKGLLWKIWLRNEAEKAAGGIYLFEDEASAEAYVARVNKELAPAVKACPICAVYDEEMKVFDIMFEHTKITRGPID